MSFEATSTTGSTTSPPKSQFHVISSTLPYFKKDILNRDIFKMESSFQCFIIAFTNLFQVVTRSASDSLSFKPLKIQGRRRYVNMAT